MMQTQTDTAISAAFRKAGRSKEDMQYYSATLAYLGVTSSESRCLALVKEAIQKFFYEDELPSPPPTQGPAAAGRPVKGLKKSKPVPVYRPSQAELDAAAASRKTTVDAVFSRKTNDGREWGNVCMHELPSIGRDGKIANFIIKKMILDESQRFEKMSSVVSAKLFKEAVALISK